MKNIILCLFVVLMVACVDDQTNCSMDCSDYKEDENTFKEQSYVPAVDKPQDPDTCEYSNKDIKGCYAVKYVPAKDDPRPGPESKFKKDILIVNQKVNN